jgi:hypothetical protein
MGSTVARTKEGEVWTWGRNESVWRQEHLEGKKREKIDRGLTYRRFLREYRRN